MQYGIFWLVVLAIAVVAFIIHGFVVGNYIDFEDIFDFDEMTDTFIEGGWITLLCVFGIGGIVFGFVFWNTTAMLLIVISPIALIGIVLALFFIIRAKRKLASVEGDTDDEDYLNDELYDIKCMNCGARLSKKNGKFYCSYCGTIYTKKQAKNAIFGFKDNDKIEEYDLDDFEEEYFEACKFLFFRPYNNHNEKQLERRYNRITNNLDNDEEVYNIFGIYDFDDAEQKLDDAKDFFDENSKEISEYMNKYTETDIKKRYEYYLSINDSDEDEEDDEDE